MACSTPVLARTGCWNRGAAGYTGRSNVKMQHSRSESRSDQWLSGDGRVRSLLSSPPHSKRSQLGHNATATSLRRSRRSAPGCVRSVLRCWCPRPLQQDAGQTRLAASPHPSAANAGSCQENEQCLLRVSSSGSKHAAINTQQRRSASSLHRPSLSAKCRQASCPRSLQTRDHRATR